MTESMPSDSYTGDINLYITNLEDKINYDSTEPEFVQLYRRAQLHLAQGFFEDSLVCLEKAMLGIRPHRSDFVWESLYISIGGLLASNLDYFGKCDEAEAVYDELLAENPKGDYICDYAIFVHKRKKDVDKAESLYERALALYPMHSSLHLKYAGFLRHNRQDVIGADQQYELATTTNPNNADALGSYASFLHGVLGNMDEAGSYYERAVNIDPTHANNLCNYGLFLSEVRSQYSVAEKHYRSALEVAPTHVNTLYNFAVMLDTHCARKEEAEALYRRALNKEPTHPFALYNLAVLLEERLALAPKTVRRNSVNGGISAIRISSERSGTASISNDFSFDFKTQNTARGDGFDGADNDVKEELRAGDMTDSVQNTQYVTEMQPMPVKREMLVSEVRAFYERAMEADPSDAATTADFGRFLWTKTGDTKEAEEVLTRALTLDSNCEVALFNLGTLLHRSNGDLDNAENALYQLIKVNPNHCGGLQQLARVLVDSAKQRQLERGSEKSALKGAMDCYEKTISLVTDPSSLLTEYLQVVNSMGDSREKMRAMSTVSVVMKLRAPFMANVDSVRELYESYLPNPNA